MNYEIVSTVPFERKVKRLSKKYKSLKADLTQALGLLSENPFQGVSLWGNCYKIRMAITSKGKGKSGGARLITFIKIKVETVYLVDIYDKSERETISEQQLKLLIEALAP